MLSIPAKISPMYERRAQVMLALAWLALHTVLFSIHGVRHTSDSESYLTYAAAILDNFHFAADYRLKYAGYPTFLALLFKIGFGLKGIVVVQTLLSGIATIYFYKATRLLAGNVFAPLLATFLLIGWYDLQMYHAFILTESLYISLLLLAFYLLVKARTVRQSLWALPLLLVVALVRPNGFIAVVAYLGYLFFGAYTAAPSPRAKVILVLPVILVPLATLLLVDQYLLQEFDIVQTYAKGEVIFGYKGLLISADKQVLMPLADASPLTKLYLFVHDNPTYFFRMSGWRFFLFWGNVKPYFSVLHNLVVVVVLYPLYFFTGAAMLKGRIRLPLRAFVAFLLLQQAFITTVTSEDPIGRFLMSVIAFVFMFGSVGLSWLLLKQAARKQHAIA
ncbi:hypothetical protein [Pontibacter liquoris]|uniref:hypothetical protein n=1 Tax=Pontibacter liquoris TaxID=2905677 RepID=UPI001FA74973|nr:hypothetical protein [Pontibacter liquoris]